jgi:hypothetical protein
MMGRFLNEGILSQFHSSGKVIAEEIVSYFAELCVFASLREQNVSAVFTLRRQVAKFRKDEIRTLSPRVKELSGQISADSYWFSLGKWHAHLARGFTGGTPVPLQTKPTPAD